MKIETDQTKTRGVVSFYPETKKERKLILKLYDLIRNSPNVQFNFKNNSEFMQLTIFRT